jgi:ABC-2 type transport system ATP-binding protein
VALIEIRALTKRYPRVTALDALTVDVQSGIVGLVGANGAGKSTLIKVLLGLIEPTAGEVRVLGLDPGREGDEVRARVGYMPEHDCLPPDLVAAEFVTHMARISGLPRAAARERASEALRHVGLYEERYRQIGGYSTGMKQRVKLAQALVHDPDLLLLDEPTNGLDPAGREAMLNLLLALGRDHGKSLILSTHLLGDVERVCEQVVILHQGRVRGQGGVGELCARRQDRYRLQVEGDLAAFAEELRLEGAQVLSDNGRGELRVAVPAGWATRAFFVLADQHDVAVRQVLRDDESLEELFLRLVNSEETMTNDPPMTHQ